LHYYQTLMASMRGAIEQGRLSAFAGQFLEDQQKLS
jgi:queuine/archaeosine tRNA-ribosyltransferase